MAGGKVLFSTWSICPVCLQKLPADRVQIGREVYLRKTCPEHGVFETIIWRGYGDISKWIGSSEAPASVEPHCPDGCGLCPDHRQTTCCVLLPITHRCNLKCRFCFAGDDEVRAEPTFEEIRQSLARLIDKGRSLVQLTGGEPTVRNDLPAIIQTARDAGAKYVQLNSNGIRLGEDKDYVKQLADAGLSFVFMQFDGTHDDIYLNIRGKALLDIKKRAIDHCAENNIGVTLVPTLVRGLNTNNIGEIIRFAIAGSPNIRGVHFQPATFMGRVPEVPSNPMRYTLDELIHDIQEQTDERVQPGHLLPSSCDHPLCGFHGDFVIDQDQLIPLLKRPDAGNCCCSPASADKNREFVARRWQRPDTTATETSSCCGDIHNMEYFLNRVKTHGFTITAMAFQDSGNIDLSRLQRCSLHVYDQGQMVPFCAYYLTGWRH